VEINDAGYVLRDANSHSITVIDKVRLGALIHKGWRALSGARPTTRQSFIHTTADARILQQLSSDPRYDPKPPGSIDEPFSSGLWAVSLLSLLNRERGSPPGHPQQPI